MVKNIYVAMATAVITVGISISMFSFLSFLFFFSSPFLCAQRGNEIIQNYKIKDVAHWGKIVTHRDVYNSYHTVDTEY